MPTIDELRRQLADEAATGPETAHRLERVHDRITVRRRQRAAGTAVAVVLPQLPSADHSAPPANPSPSVSSDLALPEYHEGGRLVAQATHEGGTPFAVPFTPINDGALFFVVECYVPGGSATTDDPTMVTLEMAGSTAANTSCGDEAVFTGGTTFTPDDLRPENTDPTALQVSIDRPVPDTSRVRVGIYQQVPRADYPFPPQPSPLPTLVATGNLEQARGEHPIRLITPDSNLPVNETDTTYVDPNGSTTLRATLEHGLAFYAQTATPGTITVRVDGRTVHSISSWIYGPNEFGANLSLDDLGVTAGEEVRITVVAEDFVGDSWAVLLSDTTGVGG